MRISLAIVGTPSPLSYSAFDVLTQIEKTAGANISVVSANLISDLTDKTAADPSLREKPLVVISDYPQDELLAFIRERDIPMIVCVDDFQTIAYLAVVSRNCHGVDAARLAASSLVSLESILCANPENTAVISHGGLRLSTLIQSICKILAIGVNEAAVTAIIRALIGREDENGEIGEYARKKAADAAAVRAELERRSPLENELIDRLAAQYEPIIRGRQLESLEWPPFALLRPDFPDRLTVGPIDLTGPARFIYYGPYFALPKGRWRAELTIEVGDCLSDNRIAIDVVSGGVLAVFNIRLPPHGVYGCAVEFEIVNPSSPVEIRLQLVTGAIEGVLLLHGIRLTRAVPD